MKGKWVDVVKLTFEGERFHDHALTLSALSELSHFQDIVTETAKTLWRISNVGKKLPNNFEERTKLCLRRIEDGSAIAPLEVFIEEQEQLELLEQEPIEVKKTVNLVTNVFYAAEYDEPLPEEFPRTLLDEYSKFGESLKEEESIRIHSDNEKSARITQKSRSRLEYIKEQPYKTSLDITGEVLEADVRQRKFQLWISENAKVLVNFDEEQEEDVTIALKEHKTKRIRIIGIGDMSPEGKPIKITNIEKLSVIEQGEYTFDPSAQPIEEIIEEIVREVPDEEWDKLPSDLTDNLDHYLYGTPKNE